MRAASPSAAGGLRPTRLRCEYLVDPLGIDVVEPRLSWIVESDERAQRQTAYRILAAGSEAALAADKADLWDSGKVQSSETSHVVYAGKPLRSGARCFWKVRVWDRRRRASAWSRPARWTVGLRNETDWQAAWIGYDKPVPPPLDRAGFAGTKWIWFAGEKGDCRSAAAPRTCRFRRAVELPADVRVRRAELAISADDQFTAYVNGRKAGASDGKSDAWRRPQTLNVAKLLKGGPNVLAVEVTNGGGPAGLVAKLTVAPAEGATIAVATDASWKCVDAVRGRWRQAGFDDRGWPAARIVGPFGCRPWEKLPSTDLVLPAPRYLRKAFALRGPVRRATVYATALGLYELRVNGRRVGDEHFQPGWTDYNVRVYCRAYDVTGLLREGDNAIGAILGDGWYAGYIGWGYLREHYGRHTRLRAQLHVEYADGAEQIVATDRTWRAATGPILEGDFLMGETYDARKEMPGWDAPGFDDADWQRVNVTRRIKATVQAHPGVPVRAFAERKPVKVTEPKPGRFVFDLGRNFAGFARLKVRADRGRKIVLRFAERLNPDGTVYTENLRSARSIDTYVCRGGGEVETWQPRFTYHGFQYVEVRGYPGRPRRDAITGVALGSDTPVVGHFECSDEMLNTLWGNIYWTQRANYLEVPTDCPQRDERLGWTGDGQAFLRAATCHADVAAFFTKWLIDVGDAQLSNGAFADVAPRVWALGGGVAAWADAGVICPWTIYQVYGDRQILARHYQAMGRFIEFCRKSSKGLLRADYGYGDWLNIRAETPKDVLATAYFACSTRLMARIAETLGKKADAARYRRLFEQIRKAFQAAYVAADGRVKGDTQTAYVLALAFDLLGEAQRPLALGRLVADIERRGGHLSCGFVGTKDLMDVLKRFGRLDVAFRLLHNDTFPSWGFMVRHGATSIWERWDGWTPDGGFQNPGMNSFAHYAFGSVGQWIFRTLGGVDLAEPGFRRIVIRPEPDEKVTWARASYESIRGRIATDWKRTRRGLALDVTIPANTTALVHLPARDARDVTEGGRPAAGAEGVRFLRAEADRAVFEVGSGRYRFVARGTR